MGRTAGIALLAVSSVAGLLAQGNRHYAHALRSLQQANELLDESDTEFRAAALFAAAQQKDRAAAALFLKASAARARREAVWRQAHARASELWAAAHEAAAGDEAAFSKKDLQGNPAFADAIKAIDDDIARNQAVLAVEKQAAKDDESEAVRLIGDAAELEKEAAALEQPLDAGQ